MNLFLCWIDSFIHKLTSRKMVLSKKIHGALPLLYSTTDWNALKKIAQTPEGASQGFFCSRICNLFCIKHSLCCMKLNFYTYKIQGVHSKSFRESLFEMNCSLRVIKKTSSINLSHKLCRHCQKTSLIQLEQESEFEKQVEP